MIQFGNDKIKEIYYGSDKIKEVYYGNELVYTAHDPRGYWVHKDTGVKTYFDLDDPSIVDGIMSRPSWIDDCSEVKLPEGVTSIGAYAFELCNSLTSFTLPEGVTSIGSDAFFGCTSLSLVTSLPTIPPSLGSYVFEFTHANLIIKVPAQSVNTYKTATNWTEHASIISAI